MNILSTNLAGDNFTAELNITNQISVNTCYKADMVAKIFLKKQVYQIIREKVPLNH